jgi:hypothetical protein
MRSSSLLTLASLAALASFTHEASACGRGYVAWSYPSYVVHSAPVVVNGCHGGFVTHYAQVTYAMPAPAPIVVTQPVVHHPVIVHDPMPAFHVDDLYYVPAWNGRARWARFSRWR